MRQSLFARAKDETGQAAALIAVLLFLVFLVFASLAIDGAMTYFVRRDLQNVADSAALAACRVIASNDITTTTPLAAAKNAVATAYGSWADYIGDNPPGSNEGKDAGLTKGVQISTRQVRVAVARTVPTVLTQFFGRPPSLMVAQARCDATAGGGLMPIAVPRYLLSRDRSNPPNPAMTDLIGRKGAPLYPNDSITVTWHGRYDPEGVDSFQVPVPCGNPGAPACAGNASFVAGDSAVPGIPDDNSGPNIVLVGQSAQTNSKADNFRNFVLLDIRNVGPQDPLEFYNGVDSVANTAKDVSQGWIYRHGYPGPNPQVGSEVEVLAGTSNNFSAKTVTDAGYQVGDIIPAIVYDGYVWKRPDFFLSVNPQSGTGISASCGSACPVDPNSATKYTIKIAQASDSNTAWGSAPSFHLSFSFTNGPLPPGAQVSITPVSPAPGSATYLTGPDYLYTIPSVSQTGWTGTLAIWDTEAVTRTPYLTGINAVATSPLNVHGLNADKKNLSNNVQFGFWNGSNVVISYTARVDSRTLTLQQGGGGGTVTDLTVYGVGTGFPNGGKNKDTCVGIPVVGSVFGNGATWSTIFSSPANISGGIDIINGKENSISPLLTVQPTAPIADYTLRFTIGPGTCNGSGSVPQNIVDIPLSIIPAPVSTGAHDSFVIIQGYALFRISGSDANDVYGYAISPLYESLDKVSSGLRPRLVPW